MSAPLRHGLMQITGTAHVRSLVNPFTVGVRVEHNTVYSAKVAFSNSALKPKAVEPISRPILPATGEWIHIAFTNDGETATIYINAEAVAEGEVPGALKANDDPWRIGQDCERLNYVFAGIIDEVSLWNRALSADEITGAQDLGVSVDPRAKLATTWGNIKIAH